MSNKTKAAGTRGRHAPQHRREPSWTVADLAGMPGGLGAKIVVAGVAGAALALPATSAFASPSSIVTKPSSTMFTFSKAASQPGAFRTHADAPAGLRARPNGQVSPPRQATQHQATYLRATKDRATEQWAAEHHQSQQTRHWPVQPTAGQAGTTGATGSAAGTTGSTTGATGSATGTTGTTGATGSATGTTGTTGATGSAAGTAGSTTGTTGSMQAGQTPAPSGSATSASQGPGLLLEANGTFVPLPPSSTNVYAIPAGSLIITSDGNLVSPPAGTYVTPYGLITVTQAPGGGAPSAGTATGTIGTTTGATGMPTGATTGTSGTSGTPTGATGTPTGTSSTSSTSSTSGTSGTPTGATGTSTGATGMSTGATGTSTGATGMSTGATTGNVYVNPGGPLQAPPQQPVPVIAAGTAAPASTGATGNAPMATGTVAKAPVAVPNAPVAAPKAAPPPVQIVSAMGGVTVADSGTVTPTGSVNLAFPSSGIGGSLPLSLPSAAPAQAAQPAFPAADQNAVLTDPIFQGLIQHLGQPPAASQPGPILNPLQDVASTAPATAAPAAVQLAANTFGANGNPVMSDASPLPAGLVQTVAQDSATQNTVAQNTVAQNTVGQNTVGQSVIPPSQGSILMVQPSIFGSPTIKPLDPGAAMTLSDGTQIQVTGDNRLQITRPNGDLYEVAPGNTYTLPDGSGNQIVVPTVPPVVLQDPGNGDTILAPGSHISLGSGGSVDVTQDGVLRVTSPDGNQVDYAPGSSFALPGGVTISPMTPPQAMNLDQNPATQLASAAGAGSQVAANTFDANGNPVASDASQLPVQLAQNQAAAPSLTPDSLTVILPDGTPQTFPLGSSTNPLAPPTFGPGNEILVPLGTRVPLPDGSSTTLDSAGTLTFPNRDLPAIHAVPAMPTSDNSPAGTTTVAMNNVDPQTGAPVASDAGSLAGRGLAPAPAATDTTPAPTPAATDNAPAPAPATTPAPAPTDVAPAPVPTDTTPAPAPAPIDVAPAPAPAPIDVAPAPAPAPTLTSSDPSTVGDPLGAPSIGGGSFGGGSFGGGSGS
jgi:hypothetical protein